MRQIPAPINMTFIQFSVLLSSVNRKYCLQCRQFASTYSKTLNMPITKFPAYVKKTKRAEHDKLIREVWLSKRQFPRRKRFSFNLQINFRRNTSNRFINGSVNIWMGKSSFYTMDHRMLTEMFTLAMLSIRCYRKLFVRIAIPF